MSFWKRRKPKLALIGLDCADPGLLFGPWLNDLPNIRSIVTAGISGQLRSITPPITVPAWMAMMTGADPGKLGIYGFRNRSSYEYDSLKVVTSADVKVPAVWDRIGAKGRSSIVIGVPPGYPPKPIKGQSIGCFLTPSTEMPYTHPTALAADIKRWVGRYLVDAKGFRSDDREALLADIYEMTEKRFTVAVNLLKADAWDLFTLVEIGVDRMHHAFWQFMDEQHVLHEPGSPYKNAIYDYYRFIDTQVGRILEVLDEDTTVMLVSDHGGKRMDGAVCLNEWLRQNGYLKLLKEPEAPTALRVQDVDWSGTTAWAEGGYYARVFMNVEGREPSGIVKPEAYEATREKLADEIRAIRNERGESMKNLVYTPQQLYREINGIPSDLFVFFDDLYRRASNVVGTDSIHTRENDTGPDGANHDWNGIIAVAPMRALGSSSGTAPVHMDILDVAGVMMECLEGQGLPGDARLSAGAAR